MKKLYALLFCILSSGTVFAQEFLVIQMASKPVMADGIIDENDPWGDNWIQQQKMTTFSSTTIMQSEFQLMYDSLNLYFAIRVTDSTRFVGNTTTFQNDAVSLFIALDTNSINGEYKTGDKHLRLQAVSDSNATGGLIECLQGAPEHGQYVCLDSGYNYVQEWIMPWSELYADIFPIWNGEGLKLDVGTSDATEDGTITQTMYWNDASDLQWNNTNHFGYASLSYVFSIDNRSDQYIYFYQLPDVNEGSNDFVVSAYSDSGLPLEYTSSNTNVAIIINDKIHIVGSGSSVITANQPGNINYKPASPVSRLLLVTSNTSDMTNLFDFEYELADTSWFLFGNGSNQSVLDLSLVANPDQSGINKSDNVLQFLVHSDANPWAGMFTDYLEEPIEITNEVYRLTMMVYKTIISPTVLKIEMSFNGGFPLEISVDNTLINQWEMLTFDMSDAIGYGYSRITVFPDFSYFRMDSTTVLLDNISFGSTVGLKVSLGNDKYVTCGESVNFDPVINYKGTGELSYSWSPPDGLSATDIPDPVVSTTTSRTYTLSVSSPDFGTVNNSVSVFVYPFSASINEISGACGRTVQLNVITNYQGSGPLSYSWYPTTGLSAADIPDPYVNLGPGYNYYNVYVESPDGCSTYAYVYIYVNVLAYTPSICMVTVNENDRNVIIINKDPENQVDSILIYRESFDQTDHYDYIGSIPYSDDGVFVDSGSNAKVQSYMYKIVAKDICGSITEYSQTHKTIHLTGIGTNGNLIWEPYRGIPISSYKIYRGTSLLDLTQIGSTSGSNISYTDINVPSGDVFYQVEGIIPDPCSTLKSTGFSSVHSNIFSNTNIRNGIGTIQSLQEFIYPNPASDILKIKPGYSPNAMVLIFDLHGKMILTGQVSEQIDISYLAEGVYIVKLIDSGKILIDKLVKE